jgi:hypothetical protein
MKKTNTANILKWLGTLILMVGAGVNSLEIYPLGIIIMVTGGMLWCVVGILWKELSLIITNAVLGLISIVGVCYTMGYFN